MTNESLNAESRLYTQIYVALLALTALTVSAYFGHFSRVPAILVALSIAGVKGGLIAWHFMQMKSERPMIWAIALIGITAVLIFGIGILPDLGWTF
jgi:caa(3)-type oxidase subunit IV